jgi:hypothetical protein
MLSKSYTSPGLDGITYEIWKMIDNQGKELKAKNKPAFDPTRCLLAVYNDIEQHGMEPDSGFSASWMCPLYKKNDHAQMANYRPISLLNTDYKVMTKALSIKLAKAAPHILNPAQASFVPGRHIYDQIWLSKLVIELAKATEQNGALVALDQEKAYDKIKHDYLWKAMKAYRIPDEFISTVKTLYSDAYTTLIVNGELSETAYRVIRGVRQGDPLLSPSRRASKNQT